MGTKRRIGRGLALAGLLFVLALRGEVEAETRRALIFGNAAYSTAPLRNPVNDAEAIARLLEGAGFVTTLVTNATRREMLLAADLFAKSLDPDAVALIYFSGHGVQIDGNNYLVPVDAHVNNFDDAVERTVPVSYFLSALQSGRSKVNIVILDACRDNPFEKTLARGARSLGGSARPPARSIGRGLAPQEAPVGTLVAFATSPGSTAYDGEGENGLYTRALLDAIGERGLRIEDIFKKVRNVVRERSGGTQIPWENTSLTGDFYFFEPDSRESQPRVIAALPPPYTPYYKPDGKIDYQKLNGNFRGLNGRWSLEVTGHGGSVIYFAANCSRWFNVADRARTSISVSETGEIYGSWVARNQLIPATITFSGKFPVIELSNDPFDQYCADTTVTLYPNN